MIERLTYEQWIQSWRDQQPTGKLSFATEEGAVEAWDYQADRIAELEDNQRAPDCVWARGLLEWYEGGEMVSTGCGTEYHATEGMSPAEWGQNFCGNCGGKVVISQESEDE